MNAFEFGYAVGQLEKQANAAAAIPHIVAGANPVNFRMMGNALATIPGRGPVGAPFRTGARQAVEGARRIGGTLAGDIAGALPHGVTTGLGAAGVLGAATSQPGHAVEGAGRGMGYGAGAMLGGGVGAGIGKSVSRMLPQKYQLAAQMVGGGLGTAGGLMGAGRLMGPAKQAGMLADATDAVKKKTENVAGTLNTAAKKVVNKAETVGKQVSGAFDKWRTSK